MDAMGKTTQTDLSQMARTASLPCFAALRESFFRLSLIICEKKSATCLRQLQTFSSSNIFIRTRRREKEGQRNQLVPKS
jgi:hypothetical protein